MLFSGSNYIWLAVFGLLFRRVSVYCVMATDSDAAVGAGLALRLISHWMFPGTFRGQLCTCIRSVWWS